MASGPSAGRFASRLLAWFDARGRDLPWRRRRDPYTTWVSEVMLQQTTVDVVTPRFEAFIDRFPDVAALAAADEDEVLRAWAGLGYYRRARALHRGAAAVVDAFGGAIPSDEAALRSLPGVGEYTAAAIAALGFGRPAAPVDGNVARVMSRILAEDGEVDRAAVRRRLAAELRRRVPEDAAGRFCEAMIELGALVCRPQAPACAECPVASDCAARAAGDPERYPVKRAPRAAIPVTSFRAVVRRGSAVLLVRRPDDASLLAGFHELPGRWTPGSESADEVLTEVLAELGLRGVRVGAELGRARHAITHHRITARAFACEARGGALEGPAAFHDPAALEGLSLTTETRKLWSSAGREEPA